jgi:hypothetical protein
MMPLRCASTNPVSANKDRAFRWHCGPPLGSYLPLVPTVCGAVIRSANRRKLRQLGGSAACFEKAYPCWFVRFMSAGQSGR